MSNWRKSDFVSSDTFLTEEANLIGCEHDWKFTEILDVTRVETEKKYLVKTKERCPQCGSEKIDVWKTDHYFTSGIQPNTIQL
ncbi:MAG: hypothetical protein GF334_00665 [Candidatus Altiarchaeales archaeon]|nr:hypothetical protein [Candidatus Altiarchaeales archaeon]